MKYRSENQLELFEFHDSIFSMIRFQEGDLSVSVKFLNIHKEADPDHLECDMEIECAIKIFIYFHMIPAKYGL